MSATFELQTDFRQEVLEESRRRPVVVDFWAAWCGPCRILGPILEKLAGEAGDAWKLVKVDADQHVNIAQALDIRSLPTVLMFHQGEVVGEFMGALPEAQVRAWLTQNLPEAPEAEQSDLDRARTALDAGDPSTAARHLQRALAQDDGNADARVLLARLRFLEDPEGAADLASPLPEDHPDRDLAPHLAHLRDLIRWGATGASSGESPDLTRYHEAARALAGGRYRDALETWIDLVAKNRALENDGARKSAVALFDALGPEHPVTLEYRSRLASALY
jgi:putative thioredoxin